MKQIEDFNNRVNSSRLYPQENKDFQDQINLLLKTFFEQLSSTDKACIIGAGNLSDFSLHEFLRIFNEVTLTDIDEISMKRALSFQRLSRPQYRQVDLRKIEYTGFEKFDLFNSLKERFVNCLSEDKIDQVVKHIFKTVEEYKFLEDETEQYDFVYVSPIYTQLLYHQISILADQLIGSGYPQHLGKHIKAVVLQQMPSLIDRFNNNIIGLLKKTGSVMVLSDIFELANSSGFFRRVKNSIKRHDVMEEIHEGYKKKYGMGLGDYGLYNLDDKMQQFICRWLIWPKDEDNSYIVKLKIYNNKGGTL